MTDSNWTEVGDSYPSCQRIYVREGIVGPGGGISLTPPLVLTEPNSTRVTTQLGTIALEGYATPFSASTRQTMRSLTPGNDASVIRWMRSDNALRYSMGNDASGNGNQNWWLFDNVNGIYPLYFQSGNAGDTVGSIRWRNGRIAYDTATEQMTRRVANVVRETFDPTQYTLTSGGLVQLTSATGMALQGGAGLILQSLDNGTLQAANAQHVIAGTTFDVVAAGRVDIDSTADELRATGATGATFQSTAGPCELTANGGDVNVSASNDVNIAAAADVDINGSDTVTVTGAGSNDGVGVLIQATAAGMVLTSVTGITVGNGGEMVGFLGAAPVVRQVINGSRSDGQVVMTALLTALATLGLITDNTTA